jgi:hypothetical protein
MKKLIYAAGVLSLGGVQVAVQAAEGEPKAWSLGLSAQGFYDDNINTAPNGPQKIGSWGSLITPSAGYNQSWDQTSLEFGASYGAYYFADTQGTLSSNWSQTANVNVGVEHTFNPRLTLDVNDNFALFQNASQVLLGQTGRLNGNNINNIANVNLSAELSNRFSLVVGYENDLFRYEAAQYASLLDRIENYGRLDLRYLISPKTVAVVGTKSGTLSYDRNLGLANYNVAPNSTSNPSSGLKNNDSYFVYGGFDHSFAPSLVGSLRAGAQIQEFYNYNSSYYQALPTGSNLGTQVNPYVDVNLKYGFTAGSSAVIGVIHRANPSDVGGQQVNGLFTPTLQQVSTALYTSVNHAITSKLSGSLVGSFQNSQYVGGYSGFVEDWWSVGATASYQVVRNLAVTVSYYYDLLNSQVPGRQYDRNRVFFGLSANY